MLGTWNPARVGSLSGGTILACGLVILVQGFSIPHQFTAGAPARASEVNENFAAVATELNESRATLEMLSSLRLKRPSFRSDGGTLVTIPASPTNPGVVLIDGELRSFASALSIDIATVGLGGLDIGPAEASTIYYAYVTIDPISNLTAAIASKKPPTTSGPAGFSSWTYLGSFLTNTNPIIEYFIFSNGQFYQADNLSTDVSVMSDTITKVDLLVPGFATTVSGRLAIDPGTDNSVGFIGAKNGESFEAVVGIDATGNRNYFSFVTLPLLESPSIYLKGSMNNDTVSFRVRGYSEDPTSFP